VTQTLTGVLDLEESKSTEETARASVVSNLETPDPLSLVTDSVPRANRAMIFSLICVAVFSVCLVVFVLYPALQTLAGSAVSVWDAAP